MKELKLRALCIRSVDVGENDKIVTLLTEENGRISASVRGSRSLKSRYFSAVQLCCYSDLVLAERGDKYYVKEAELVENFFSIRESIERTALAGYICESVGYVATEGEPSSALFRLTLNILYAISREEYSLRQIKAAYEWRISAILGFLPDLSRCADCEKTEGDFTLDVMNGNILCTACRENANRIGEIYADELRESRILCVLNQTARRAADYILHCPLARLLSFRIDEESLRLLAIAGETYFLNQIEHGFPTLQFYKDILKIAP